MLSGFVIGIIVGCIVGRYAIPKKKSNITWVELPPPTLGIEEDS